MIRWGVAVDVGNFAIKARFVQLPSDRDAGRGEPTRFPLHTDDWFDTLARWYEQQRDVLRIADDACLEWRVASVNPPPARRLRDWVEARSAPPQPSWQGTGPKNATTVSHVWREVSFRDVPLRLDVRKPAAVGIDRLIAAWAAWQGRSAGPRSHGATQWMIEASAKTPRRPVMVVDAGSAITVDLVDANGTFRGGAILPGRQLQLKSLGLGAFALPDLANASPSAADDQPPPSTLECPGRDTAAAIELGVRAGMAGAIGDLHGAFRQMVDQPLKLVLTGGDAPLLMGRLDPAVHWVPTLLLDGLAAL